MTAADLLGRLAELLEAAAVPYMLTGSVVSSLYGAPRSTQDVDVVVELDPAALERLLAFLDEEHYYVSPAAAREALQVRGMFNLVDFRTGWKVDLVVRKDRPFSREEFSRRRSQEVFGRSLYVASPEDAILSKLEWNRIRPSERQLRDVAGIIEAQAGSLDTGYLEGWARDLGVLEEWNRLCDG